MGCIGSKQQDVPQIIQPPQSKQDLQPKTGSFHDALHSPRDQRPNQFGSQVSSLGSSNRLRARASDLSSVDSMSEGGRTIMSAMAMSLAPNVSEGVPDIQEVRFFCFTFTFSQFSSIQIDLTAQNQYLKSIFFFINEGARFRRHAGNRCLRG